MDLQTLSQLAEVFGFIAVLAAIIFGYIQIKDAQHQRNDLAAIELVRSFQNSEFTTAFRLIHSLPENIPADEFEAKGTEYIDAAYALSFDFETTGVLVYRGVIPLAAVEQLIGGIAITLWKRLSPWIHHARKEQSQEQILEWFQWLAERLEERSQGDTEPAFIKHKDWKPS